MGLMSYRLNSGDAFLNSAIIKAQSHVLIIQSHEVIGVFLDLSGQRNDLSLEVGGGWIV